MLKSLLVFLSLFCHNPICSQSLLTTLPTSDQTNNIAHTTTATTTDNGNNNKNVTVASNDLAIFSAAARRFNTLSDSLSWHLVSNITGVKRHNDGQMNFVMHFAETNCSKVEMKRFNPRECQVLNNPARTICLVRTHVQQKQKEIRINDCIKVVERSLDFTKDIRDIDRMSLRNDYWSSVIMESVNSLNMQKRFSNILRLYRVVLGTEIIDDDYVTELTVTLRSTKCDLVDDLKELRALRTNSCYAEYQQPTFACRLRVYRNSKNGFVRASNWENCRKITSHMALPHQNKLEKYRSKELLLNTTQLRRPLRTHELADKRFKDAVDKWFKVYDSDAKNATHVKALSWIANAYSDTDGKYTFTSVVAFYACNNATGDKKKQTTNSCEKSKSKTHYRLCDVEVTEKLDVAYTCQRDILDSKPSNAVLLMPGSEEEKGLQYRSLIERDLNARANLPYTYKIVETSQWTTNNDSFKLNVYLQPTICKKVTCDIDQNKDKRILCEVESFHKKNDRSRLQSVEISNCLMMENLKQEFVGHWDTVEYEDVKNTTFDYLVNQAVELFTGSGQVYPREAIRVMNVKNISVQVGENNVTNFRIFLSYQQNHSVVKQRSPAPEIDGIYGMDCYPNCAQTNKTWQCSFTAVADKSQQKINTSLHDCYQMLEMPDSENVSEEVKSASESDLEISDDLKGIFEKVLRLYNKRSTSLVYDKLVSYQNMQRQKVSIVYQQTYDDNTHTYKAKGENFTFTVHLKPTGCVKSKHADQIKLEKFEDCGAVTENYTVICQVTALKEYDDEDDDDDEEDLFIRVRFEQCTTVYKRKWQIPETYDEIVKRTLSVFNAQNGRRHLYSINTVENFTMTPESDTEPKTVRFDVVFQPTHCVKGRHERLLYENPDHCTNPEVTEVFKCKATVSQSDDTRKYLLNNCMQVQNIHLSGPITEYNTFDYTGQMPDIQTLSERALNAYNKLVDSKMSYEILSIEDINFKYVVGEQLDFDVIFRSKEESESSKKENKSHLVQCHVHWSNRPWLYEQDLMKLGECVMIEMDAEMLQTNVWFEDFNTVARLLSEEMGEYDSFKLASIPHWNSNISDGKRHRMNVVLAKTPYKISTSQDVVEEENHSKLLVGAALNCTVEIWVRPWLNNSRLVKIEHCDEYEHYLMDKIYMTKPVKKIDINLSQSLRRYLHVAKNSLISYTEFMNEAVEKKLALYARKMNVA
ncbi:unnamed protein product [Trichobilharzia szidati]|nr:unnamed protein product [Trichobilharzia szidati]